MKSVDLLFIRNLRGLLIILAVIMYATKAYTVSGEFNYLNYILSYAPVMEDSGSYFFDNLHDFLDLFVMQILFFFAGFFCFTTYLKHGFEGYVITRFNKLMIPFFLAVTVVMPIAYYPSYLLAGNSESFAYYFTNHYFQNYWNPGPAWFFWVLFTYDLILALILRFVPVFYTAVTEKLSQYSEYKIMMAILFVAMVSYIVSFYIWPARDIESWVNIYGPFWVQKNRIALDFVLYMSGVLIGGCPILRVKLLEKGSRLTQLWAYWFGMALAWFVVLKLLQGSNFISTYAQDNNVVGNVIYSILQVIVALNIQIALVSAFIKFYNRELPGLTIMGELMYPVYLVFFPVVTYSQYFLYGFNMDVMSKFIIVTLISLPLSIFVGYLILKLPRVELRQQA